MKTTYGRAFGLRVMLIRRSRRVRQTGSQRVYAQGPSRHEFGAARHRARRVTSQLLLCARMRRAQSRLNVCAISVCSSVLAMSEPRISQSDACDVWIASFEGELRERSASMHNEVFGLVDSNDSDYHLYMYRRQTAFAQARANEARHIVGARLAARSMAPRQAGCSLGFSGARLHAPCRQ